MSAGPAGAGYTRRPTCPCCGTSADRAAVAIASRPQAEDLKFEQHGSFASGYTAGRIFFTYHRCAMCGALYCPLFYSETQLRSLYAGLGENMPDLALRARERTQRGYADLIMRYSRRGGGFVEIGPDIGLFAERCARLGSFEHFWFYEPNLSVHGELAARFRDRAHTIRSAMHPTHELPAASCSTAALIHVLDHLLEPKAFLARISDALEDNGVIVAVTHNTASLLARVLGPRFPPFALQHPQLFSPSSIRTLFEQAGYEIVRIGGAVNYFPVMHLVRAGFSVFGLPVPRWPVAGTTLPIQLGNMLVIARKRARR